MDIWDWLIWIHLLAMAFFIGGQLMLAAVVVPVARKLDDPEPIRAVARRFGAGTLIAFAVLIATGAAMASHFELWGETKLQIKLTLFVIMAVLIWAHTKRPQMHAIEGVNFLISLAIAWLGVAIAN